VENNTNLLEIQCNDVYFSICYAATLQMYNNKFRNDFILSYSSNKKPYYKTKNNFSIKNVVILCSLFHLCVQSIKKMLTTSNFDRKGIYSSFFKCRNVSKHFPDSEEEAFSKSLLEECISSLILLLKVKTTTQRPSVRMSQNKHHLKYVQEYLRMVCEVMIDKEHLDYLDHHKTFYMCKMTDNLQYWMIVEKGLFIVCCENGGLPLHNTLLSLQFFKLTHHNIASIFFLNKKKKQCNDIGRHFVEFFHGHDFLNTNVQWQIIDERGAVPAIMKIFQGLKIQWKRDNKHSK
ncbi:hypothetical protein RFI_31424, partial [Reticulomyxa filosa]